VTGVDVLTAEVEIENVAELTPPATVTVPGSEAAPVLLLDSDTVAPPCGAAPESLTVPCAPVPPVTLCGLTETLWSVAGGGSAAGVVTANVPVRVAPL
jgi:hypothetical protein